MKLFGAREPGYQTTFIIKYNKDTTLQILASCEAINLSYSMVGLQISFYESDNPENLVDIPYEKKFFQEVEDMAYTSLLEEAYATEEEDENDGTDEEPGTNIIQLHKSHYN